MSININGNEYIFEEEDLEDIEYLEIMSIDDIIKDNPSFIALSSDEIKSSLFELFANKKKANTKNQNNNKNKKKTKNNNKRTSTNNKRKKTKKDKSND